MSNSSSERKTAKKVGASNSVSMVRIMTGTAMLGAVSFILMYLDFNLPIVPSFLKMDFSDLPALIASFAYGPISGVIVCLIKNLLHLFKTSTGGVGELSNFLLACFFVVPAGIIYKIKKTKTSAIIGAMIGAVCMAVLSIVSNYFLVYPIYYNFLPKAVILQMYQALYYKVDSIMDCLIIFNMPFTFIKAMCSVLITIFIYKPLSPILKGNSK